MQGEPQTVYADVLFLLNFLLTWAMIRCTGILTGRKTSGWREAAGSLAGGAGAMLLLFSLAIGPLVLYTAGYTAGS